MKTVHAGSGFYVPDGTMCPLGCDMPFHIGTRYYNLEGGGKSSIGCTGFAKYQAVTYLQTERLIAALNSFRKRVERK
jgi:hypothetical protein